MFSLRDAVWSILICLALFAVFDFRPAWDARRFVERDSQRGFLEAYAGHRYVNGEVITPAEGKGLHVDPLAPVVVSTRLEVTAERVAWNGKRAELVVHHVVELAETGAGSQAAHDVHLRLEKRDGAWVYTLFELRGRGPLEDPEQSNPWSRALRL